MCFPDPGAEINLFYVFFDTFSSTFNIACANEFVDIFPWQMCCELYVWEESRFINAPNIHGPTQRDSLLDLALGIRTCYGMPDLALFTRNRNWPDTWTFSLNSLFGIQLFWPHLAYQYQYDLEAPEGCMQDCVQGYVEECVLNGQQVDVWDVRRRN